MPGRRVTARRYRIGHGSSSRFVLLVGCMFVASRFGLVALIANGYRALAYIMLAVFVLPLSPSAFGAPAVAAPRTAPRLLAGDLKMKRSCRAFTGVVLVVAAARAGSPRRPPVSISASSNCAGIGAPGMAIAIVEGGKDDAGHGLGRAQASRTNQPVDADTIFFTGSTGKAFTIAALATLVDAGKIKWDDKVIDHMPGLPHVGPVGHARDDGARPAGSSQRPRPRRGRSPVRPQQQPVAQGDGAAASAISSRRPASAADTPTTTSSTWLPAS